MIYDTLTNWTKNQEQYGDAVKRALAYVKSLDTEAMPPMLELVGKEMIVMKQTPETAVFSERLAEIHAQHADIHIVLEGEEWQGFAPASDRNEAVRDQLADSDYALYEQVWNERFVRLTPGDFTVYWPGEYHRPNCNPEGAVPLVKLVVKIHRSLF